MDRIKIFVTVFIEGAATMGLRNCNEGAKGRRKFPTIDPLTVRTDLQKVLVISELAATHDSMKLLQRPMRLLIRIVSRITRPDRQKRSTNVMEKRLNLVRSHRQEKAGGGGLAITADVIRERRRRQS
jgi:hypothetical protein